MPSDGRFGCISTVAQTDDRRGTSGAMRSAGGQTKRSVCDRFREGHYIAFSKFCSQAQKSHYQTEKPDCTKPKAGETFWSFLVLEGLGLSDNSTESNLEDSNCTEKDYWIYFENLLEGAEEMEKRELWFPR